jgi:hypothetical protein
MTQDIKIATIGPGGDKGEADMVQRMGLAVVRQWGALSTDVKALLRDQAVAVDLEGGQAADVSARLDAFLRDRSGKN